MMSVKFFQQKNEVAQKELPERQQGRKKGFGQQATTTNH
jgi:hypothetical protein